jgi:hypothetical protein
MAFNGEGGDEPLGTGVPHGRPSGSQRSADRIGTEIGTEAFGTEKEPGGSRQERDVTPGILITYKRRGQDAN